MILNIYKYLFLILLILVIIILNNRKEKFSKNIHIKFNFDKNSFSSKINPCIIDKISGYYSDNTINNISFINGNNVLYSSGKLKEGTKFSIKCPKNSCINSYSYNDRGLGGDSSLFSGIGNFICGTTLIPKKYGNNEFNNSWNIKNNISQSNCKTKCNGGKTLELGQYKYKVFYYSLDDFNNFRDKPYKSEYISNSSINFDWKYNTVLNSGAKDKVGLHFFGYIIPPSTGKYIFKIKSNDGVFLKINDKEYINKLNIIGKNEYQTTEILLAENVIFNFEIKYKELYDDAYLKFFWKKPGSKNWEIIPKNSFFY